MKLLASPVQDQKTRSVRPCFYGGPSSYPPLLDRFIQKLDPAQDAFPTEIYVLQLEKAMAAWRNDLLRSPQSVLALGAFLSTDLLASSFEPHAVVPLGVTGSLRTEHRSFSAPSLSRSSFLQSWGQYAGGLLSLRVAEFEIYGVRILSQQPLRVESDVHYDFVGSGAGTTREQRTGSWTLQWEQVASGEFLVKQWTTHRETRARLTGPGFVEITASVIDPATPAARQLAAGIDDWRTTLDAAIGLDVYGNHGIAVGDIDGGGRDSIYVCQPSGLPNRLFRNRGDGTFEDITDRSGTGMLDGTASALFADFSNRGRQDLLVVRSTGPLLFENMGDGRFEPRPNAFHFARPPRGTFTSVAAADYDRDGFLDLYFCVYSYYQGLSQYQFPSPYYDAQNGPPNFLFRNRGDGTFEDVTVPSGVDVNNNRFSFAVEWCDYDGDGWPDLYVANDFGRKNLYHNERNGTFTDVAAKAGVEDYGPGMSTCWLDYDGDGAQDLYVANMWLPQGRRITAAPEFLADVPEEIRALYRKHNAGNSMYRNLKDGAFENKTEAAGTSRGGWSWSCAAWDYDHSARPGLYVANGFISSPEEGKGGVDLQSFFWRQVAQRSAGAAATGNEYELAWNAVNELVRSGYSWSGHQRNNFYANNGDGTFTDVSGVLGLDLLDDSRAFALADFDGDGRLEFALKNRTGPQLRVLRNDLKDLGHAIAFRLIGSKSNRDAIGTLVTVEQAGRRQTKQLSAGSGFASQHTKELFFGLGDATGPLTAIVRWPNGDTTRYEDLPVDRRITLEEAKSGFHAVPFANPRLSVAAPAALPAFISPETVKTWLAAPLFGPDLKLADAQGTPQLLSALRGAPALLVFLDLGCGQSAQQLAALQRAYQPLRQAGLAVFAVHAKSSPEETLPVSGGPFPVLAANKQELAAWNIQYRYLFDRRRDLTFPTTLLLESSGAAIRIYQGPVDPEEVIADYHGKPSTAETRLVRAVPFAGPYFGGPITRDDFTYAVAFVEYGLLDDAQASLERAIKSNPNYAAAWFNLGTVFLNKKQYAEAERALREAVRLNPQDADAWNNLGMIAGEQNRYDDALVSFRNSARADPNHLNAVTNMMQIYQYQSRPADAQSAMEELVAKAPENPDLRLGLAMALQGQNNSAGAIEQLRTAIRLRPNFPDAINNLGTVLMQKGETAAALTEFERCRQLAPDFDRVILNEAVLYSRAGDTQKARDLLRAFLKDHPTNPDVRTMLDKLEAS